MDPFAAPPMYRLEPGRYSHVVVTDVSRSRPWISLFDPPMPGGPGKVSALLRVAIHAMWPDTVCTLASLNSNCCAPESGLTSQSPGAAPTSGYLWSTYSPALVKASTDQLPVGR